MSEREQLELNARFRRVEDVSYMRTEDVLRILLALEEIACEADSFNLNSVANFIMKSSLK